MSRRHAAEKRAVLPDAKYGDIVLSKFMSCLMYQGKRSVAETIVYGALDLVKTKSTQDISLWRYVTHVTGLVLWITYAFIIGNMPVALTNGVGLILASVVLCLKVKYG